MSPGVAARGHHPHARREGGLALHRFHQPGLGQQEGNTYTGFDVSVAKYVAKELGFEGDKVKFKESPSAQRETLLQSGQVKMIFATYSITDERKQKVSFGGPYFIAGQDLLVKSDNTDITGPETLNGKISDAMCGAKHAEGEHDGKKMTDAECVEACLKHGAKYVFVSGDKVYKIANQDLPGIKANAGKNVTVTGETKGDTVTIAKIEAAKPAK